MAVEPDVGNLKGQVSLELLSMLTSMDFFEQSPTLRESREKIESVLLARRFTARLAEFPGHRLLVAAAAHRTGFLKAIDAGCPLPASEVRQMVTDVPGCLTALGHALPSAEALSLVGQFGPVLEVGAGTGLWARALVQAGIDVLASDIGVGEHIGLAGHVLKGWSASSALASPFSRHRSLLMLWPTITEDGWVDQAITSLERGSVLLVGSPELDFLRDLIRRHGAECRSISALSREGTAVLRRLEDRFLPLHDAPLASSAPDRLDVRLRAYRRM
jgi:hypothetical protein